MDAVEKAFQTIDRKDFVPCELINEAYGDYPLPIGYGQTISQPSTVRQMLEWLDPKPGERILDIGSGSGWTTALLANIVGSKGHIYAVEKVPELLEIGNTNCNKVGISNVSFHPANKEYGLKKYSPFDRILVSASAQKLPETLIKQLRTGGKLIIPIKNEILEITKLSDDINESIMHSGFIFVPLV